MTDRSLFVLVPPAAYTRHMPNLGDRALHEGMAALLQACHQGPRFADAWNSFPNMTWRRLSAGGGTPTTRFADWYARYQRWTARPVPLQQALAGLLFGPALAWAPFWPLLDRLAHQRTGQSGRDALAPRLFPSLAARRFAGQLATSDAVIMNAGGLLADHLARYLPGRIFALHAALQAGRPTAVVNYSFAVTRPELVDWVAPVMRAVTLHAVRESQSRDRLLALGVDPGRIVLTRDAAFAAAAPPAPPLSTGRPTIAVQVRGDRPQDLAAWADLIGALRTRFNARVVHLVGCLKYDPPILAALRRRVLLDSAEGLDSADALKTAIGGAHVLITDRYHGLVFAAQMGTPFVPLASTTHKTEGLVADLDYPGRIHPPLTVDGIPAILDDVAARLAARDVLSAALKNRAETFQAQIFSDYHSIMARLMPVGANQPTRRIG